MSVINYTFGNLITENEIITNLHRGDKNTLAVIFGHCHLALRYFAKQCLISFSDRSQIVEDIVADGFIKLWQKKSDFDSLADIKAFLYETVKDGCISQLRSKYRDGLQIQELGAAAKADMIKAELTYKIWQDIER